MHDALRAAGLGSRPFEYSDYVFDPEREAARPLDNLADVLGAALAIVMILAAAFLIWTWTLRRTVAIRTKQLVERDRKLSESEGRYTRAIEGAAAGIWDWNAKTGEKYFSPR